MAPLKHPKVVEAEITDDGHIIVTFNKAYRTDTRKCVFYAEALIEIAETHSRFPEPDESDFPDIPVVDGQEDGDSGDDEGADDGQG